MSRRIFLFLFLFINNWCLVLKAFNVELYMPEVRCQDGDHKVFLIDNLLGEEELGWFADFMQRHRPWVLNNHDPHEKNFIDMKNNASWVSPVSLELFQRTRLWRKLSEIVNKLARREYYLCDAMFTMTYRMDFNPVSKDVEDEHGLMVGIFLNNDMKKNDYGERVFYNNDSEVLCGVYPVPGRVLIWNSSISYIAKPPSMLYVQSQNSIVLKLSAFHEKYQNCLDRHKENEKSVFVKSKHQDFPFTDKKSVKLQRIELGDVKFEEHLTNKYFDSHGHEIAIFDDILTKNDLNVLRAHLVKDYNSFGFQPYDTDKTEDHDNVAWISTQKVESLVKSGMWKVVKKVVQYLSGLDEWYPYDVSMNIVHSFHHTRIHEDCETYEHEYTFLLYLNPDWKENDYGETVFFDLVNSAAEVNQGDEEYEIVAVVRPRYGRIVVFRGIIPHSARPPSPGFKGARYTFACKVSKTHRTARSKQIRETIEALQGFGVEDPESEILWEELTNGEHTKQSEGRPENFLETELTKHKQRLTKLLKNSQEFLLKKLSESS